MLICDIPDGLSDESWIVGWGVLGFASEGADRATLNALRSGLGEPGQRSCWRFATLAEIW